MTNVTQNTGKRVAGLPEPLPNKPAQVNWMDPLNVILWKKAFRKKLEVVQTRDGKEFICDYESRPGHVWVKPVRGSLPCGWFDLDRFQRQ